ncbi:hypothetical protein JX265_007164 [Neoarthrinium moseri]|uniref:Antifreeze protein n=1 Tax=Neoarthrinium moseri TaxID=1658444 RepID=A0A9P9WKK4_9PEZI|nr:uncharacterized protein JN550_010063 [Neoarthrinium moseri]KAI1862726.1 hypothetical protein JN550_010063 [Neoarthrinium moseri]KAI1868341.1 hypothetical protein JX265_007164 [Neoarthrinium moseri]
MYSPQLVIATLLAASAALTGAVSIQPRQSSLACNAARLQIIKALSDTKKSVADIQDPTVQQAAAAGVKQAQQGVTQVAASLLTGQAPSADGRNTVEAGLNATATALAGGDSADPAVATTQTALDDAVTAGQNVVANC